MRRSTALSIAAALVPFGLLVWRFAFVSDDGYIAMRFGQNLARGHGLVFNPGWPAVEGYTQFLWVVWLGVLEGIGLPGPIFGPLTTGICAVLLIAWTARHAAERLELGPLPTLAAALFLGTLPTLAMWATGGLETMAFALFVFGTYATLLGQRERPRTAAAALFAVAMVLTRENGVYPLTVLVTVGAFQALFARRRELWKPLLFVAFCVLLAKLAQIGWRQATYGDWVPQTVRAKVGLSSMTLERGAKYVGSYWLTLPAMFLVPLLATPRALARWRGPWLAICAMPWSAALYGVLAGGDFMAWGRFFVPAAPFVALFFAELVGRVERARGPRVARVAMAAVVLASLPPVFDVHLTPLSWREPLHFRWNTDTYVTEKRKYDHMRHHVGNKILMGRAIARYVPAGRTLVAGGIGALSYYGDILIYDRNGYVSPEVVEEGPPRQRRSPGHDRSVLASFFAPKKPDYLQARLDDWEEPLPPREAVPIVRGAEEFYPLRPEDGFPAGRALVLVRFSERERIAVEAAPARLQDLDWLRGSWRSREGDGLPGAWALALAPGPGRALSGSLRQPAPGGGSLTYWLHATERQGSLELAVQRAPQASATLQAPLRPEHLGQDETPRPVHMSLAGVGEAEAEFRAREAMPVESLRLWLQEGDLFLLFVDAEPTPGSSQAPIRLERAP